MTAHKFAARIVHLQKDQRDGAPHTAVVFLAMVESRLLKYS